MLLRLQTRAHRFKHQITLLCVIFENVFQDVAHTEAKYTSKFEQILRPSELAKI